MGDGLFSRRTRRLAVGAPGAWRLAPTLALEDSVMSKIGIFVLAACLVAAAGSPVLAHHSFAMFDRTKQVSLVGTVKDFQYSNPHSWIQLVVKSSSGSSDEWTIEALSPNVLSREGWKRNSLLAGQKVTVVINPLRDGTHGGNLISVTLPDGVTLGGGAG
jgi:hypothetical protein